MESTIDRLVYPTPDPIEETTTYLTLEAGDVIATGATSGVGPLSDGDSVKVDVEGVGVPEHSAVRPVVSLLAFSASSGAAGGFPPACAIVTLSGRP